MLTRLDRAQTSDSQSERNGEIYLYLALAFCIVLILSRWITRHIQGIGYLITEDSQVALILYFLVVLPGVLLHELSHAAAALLLGVRVRRMSLGLQRKGNSQKFALGSVDIARTDPIRASIIGLAPLVAGCIAILMIGNRVLGVDTLPPFGGPGFWQAFDDVYNTPDFWLWIYLVVAIGNAMFPSAADRYAWGTALVFIAFVGSALYFSGLLDGVSLALARWGRNAASQLTYAFAVTAAADVVSAALLFLTESGLALLGFGRVEYG